MASWLPGFLVRETRAINSPGASIVYLGCRQRARLISWPLPLTEAGTTICNLGRERSIRILGL